MVRLLQMSGIRSTLRPCCTPATRLTVCVRHGLNWSAGQSCRSKMLGLPFPPTGLGCDTEVILEFAVCREVKDNCDVIDVQYPLRSCTMGWTGRLARPAMSLTSTGSMTLTPSSALPGTSPQIAQQAACSSTPRTRHSTLPRQHPPFTGSDAAGAHQAFV